MEEIVIAGAARTPIGKFGGALAPLPAHGMGVVAIRAALERARTAPEEVDEVVMGQVLAAGEGQNPARQAAVKAGIPVERTAYGLNQVCGSGLRAVAQGFQSIALGDARVVVAGGQESMSRAPHLAHLRSGTKMGSATLADSMVVDGLTDAFHGGHMGTHIEALAGRFQVTRAQQDAFALESQRRAAKALAEGRFDGELAPVTVEGRKGPTVVARDEYPRPDLTEEQLARLAPAFVEGGTVTAGNASGLNDGAAALVLMRGEEARARGVEPLGRIVSWATAGVDPRDFGLGPVPASRKALDKAGWRVEDLDLVEANEAYAAQALLVNRDLGWDPARVNVNGGAIALGHPLGASGARVLVTLLHELRRQGKRRGLATLCIGGGMGIALCVERG
jgi:acetyl-CoA C-acetyltransferase